VTTQLNFSAAANPVAALVGAGLSDAKAAPAGSDSSAGNRFAEVFTGQMLKLQRQGLATAPEGLGSLQMMPLGQTFNVITSDAPVPDIHSLLAFAKAQGLDDAAVAGLFGELPAAPQGLQTSMLLPQGVPQPPALAQGVSALGQLPTDQQSGVAMEAITAQAQALTVGSLQGLPGVAITGLQITPKQAAVEAGTTGPADAGLRAQEAVPVALALASNLALAAQPPLAPVQVAEVQATTAEASPPMLDALRIQMGIPSEAITRRLAQMSGAKNSLTWAELVAKAANQGDDGSLAAPPVPAVPMSTASAAGAGSDAALALTQLSGPASERAAPAAADPLTHALEDDVAPLKVAQELVTVDVPAGLDLGALGDRGAAPTAEVATPRQSPTPEAAQTPQSAAEATRAAIQERAAQTQQLADRMGQALANRLISQIERGQWKLQLHMQPAALGRVDVALDMHAGGLDAVFRTDNALTQDLLGQGAQRLREALTQSGTTVASVTVHADARGQSGGNSTPQKRQPSPKQSAAPVAVGAVPSKAARYTGGVAEGLNVLA
jgi:flagellar hook-length control protein FliK